MPRPVRAHSTYVVMFWVFRAACLAVTLHIVDSSVGSVRDLVCGVVVVAAGGGALPLGNGGCGGEGEEREAQSGESLRKVSDDEHPQVVGIRWGSL